MKHVRLLAWAVCAVLLPVSVAWAQAPGRTAEQDDVFWESVLGCTSAVEVEMYISEFGEEGRHVAEARACLEKLRKAVPDSGRKTASTEVERLLEVCEMHFTANRLTTGVGGTALGCYRKVQSLDPANREAVEGLQRVFGKYAAWARAALERGDVGDARGYVEKLKGLAPEAPEVAELESGVARLEKQAAEAREKAERGTRGADSTPTTTSAANCDGWNTKAFFEQATPERVAGCLRAGADLNDRSEYGRTPLHLVAAFTNNPAVVTALLKAGADPNARDKAGEVPLHRAARSNATPAVAATLIKAGADLNARSKFGYPPLHLAAGFNQTLAVTAALLAAGADPNAGDKRGNTPLHMAAMFTKNPAVVTALLKAGADLKARDKFGAIPLHLAAGFNQTLAVIAALLEAGADPNARDENGKTPVDMAHENKNPAVLAALKKAAGR